MRRLPRAFNTSNPLAKTCESIRCSHVITKIKCPNERVKAPQTAYERAIYDKSTYSPASIRWLEFTSKALEKRIHHALCGHGGAWCIAGAPVDRYARTRLPEHVDSIPISRLPVARMCIMLSEWHKIVNIGKTRDEAFFATAERTTCPCLWYFRGLHVTCACLFVCFALCTQLVHVYSIS